MAEEAHAPSGRHGGGQAGVELHRRVGVQQTQAVGAHQARPLAAGQLHQTLLAPGPLRAGLGKASGQGQQAPGALLQGRLGHGDHLRSGDRQDHQVRRLRQGVQGGVGPHALDGPGVGVDGIDHTLEAALQDVAEDGVANGVGIPGGADHGHRLRAQEGHQRVGGGDPLSDLGSLPVGLGGVEREVHMDDAALHGPAGLEARVPEDVVHLVVLVEHVRFEAQVAGAGRQARDALEDEAADAPALVLVGDHEADLGVGPALAHIVPQAQHALGAALALHGQEAGPQAGLRGAELLGEAAGDAGHTPHEAHGQGFPGQALDEGVHPIRVLRGGHAEGDPLAVLQEDELLVLCAVWNNAEHGMPHEIGRNAITLAWLPVDCSELKTFLALYIIFHSRRGLNAALNWL